jgi:subtilisin family serine protease
MNMSLQGSYPSGSSPYIFDPIAKIIKSTPECMYVVAAGNNGLNLDTTSGPGVDIYPAEFTYDNIVTVGATDTAGNRAIFNAVQSSNYGATSVDLFAPGLGMWGLIQNGNFVQESGTSQAAPEVAALACLYWALNPTASVAVVKKQLRESGRVRAGISGLCVGNASGSCTELNPAPMLGGTCP